MLWLRLRARMMLDTCVNGTLLVQTVRSMTNSRVYSIIVVLIVKRQCNTKYLSILLYYYYCRCTATSNACDGFRALLLCVVSYRVACSLARSVPCMYMLNSQIGARTKQQWYSSTVSIVRYSVGSRSRSSTCTLSKVMVQHGMGMW